MTSLLARVALATALTAASALGLVGISGLIIFSDVKVPEPAAVAQEQLGGAGKPLTITGPSR